MSLRTCADKGGGGGLKMAKFVRTSFMDGPLREFFIKLWLVLYYTFVSEFFTGRLETRSYFFCVAKYKENMIACNFRNK